MYNAGEKKNTVTKKEQIQPEKNFVGSSRSISISSLKRFWRLCQKNFNSGLTIIRETTRIKTLEVFSTFPEILQKGFKNC